MRRWWDILLTAGGVFEQGLVEVIDHSLGVSEVVGSDREDVSSELEFQNDAGAGDLGAGLSEFALVST